MKPSLAPTSSAESKLTGKSPIKSALLFLSDSLFLYSAKSIGDYSYSFVVPGDRRRAQLFDIGFVFGVQPATFRAKARRARKQSGHDAFGRVSVPQLRRARRSRMSIGDDLPGGGYDAFGV